MKNLFILIALCACFLSKIQAQPPPQYAEQNLSISIPVGKLEGTLVLPNGVENPNLVIIIAGSGPTDRNCNSQAGLKTNAFKMLADSLARLGVASFRYDKRGVGASKVTQKQTDVVFEDFVNDVISWVDTLQSLKKFKKITLVGHSEGSLIGSLAAQKSAAVDRMVSLCGMPLAMDSILYVQLKKQEPLWVQPLRDIFTKWKNGEKADSIPQMLMSVAHPSLRGFMSSVMKYEPAKEFQKLQKPVLFIGGKNDVQVTPDLFENLAKAKHTAQLIMFEKMTHILKDGTNNPFEVTKLYTQIDLPITEGVAEAIAAFVKEK
jgi:uncharacterized protein